MYLVFDVGGTFVKYAVMTAAGEIVEKSKMPTRNRNGDGVSEFVSSLANIYQLYKEKYCLEGIALGIPGQIDVDHGIVYTGGGLPFLDQVPLEKILSEQCGGIRVSMENDGKCAALAELWMGNAREYSNACVLVFGTGIGGGIIIDRKLHRGNHLLAGELSYWIENMSREELQRVVATGEHFWLNQSSTGVLVKRAAMEKGLSPEEVDGEQIYRWAEEGDTVIQDLLEDTYFGIAKMCCNLFMAFDPDIILVGGGISEQPEFIDGIRRHIENFKKIEAIYGKMKLDVCRYHNDSNLIGALFNFYQKYRINYTGRMS